MSRASCQQIPSNGVRMSQGDSRVVDSYPSKYISKAAVTDSPGLSWCLSVTGLFASSYCGRPIMDRCPHSVVLNIHMSLAHEPARMLLTDPGLPLNACSPEICFPVSDNQGPFSSFITLIGKGTCRLSLIGEGIPKKIICNSETHE